MFALFIHWHMAYFLHSFVQYFAPAFFQEVSQVLQLRQGGGGFSGRILSLAKALTQASLSGDGEASDQFLVALRSNSPTV